MKIPILYEDNHLLIVEKPVNIPVQGDESGDKDLLTLLKEDIKVRYNKRRECLFGFSPPAGSACRWRDQYLQKHPRRLPAWRTC